MMHSSVHITNYLSCRSVLRTVRRLRDFLSTNRVWFLSWKCFITTPCLVSEPLSVYFTCEPTDSTCWNLGVHPHDIIFVVLIKIRKLWHAISFAIYYVSCQTRQVLEYVLPGIQPSQKGQKWRTVLARRCSTGCGYTQWDTVERRLSRLERWTNAVVSLPSNSPTPNHSWNTAHSSTKTIEGCTELNDNYWAKKSSNSTDLSKHVAPKSNRNLTVM